MAGYFAMGGYALYVWSAYVAALVIMAGMVVATLRRLRSVQRDVAVLEQQRPARRRGRAPSAAEVAPEASR